jgi:hypothetical protein
VYVIPRRNIDNMGPHRSTGARRVDPSAAHNGTAGSHLTGCDLLEGQAPFRIGAIQQHTVLIRHLLHRDIPGFRGALAHLALNVLRRMVRRPAGLEGGRQRRRRYRGKACARVTNFWVHILEWDPQRLGKLLGNRRPRAADVRRALSQMHRAIVVHHR